MRTDMQKAITRIITLLALSASLTGCMSFNPKSLRQMEAALLESNPDIEFASQMKFGIGALTMDFVDFAFVHDRAIDVSKISRADIGIYELKHPMVFNDFQVPQSDDCPRREVIVRVREEGEHIEIAVCIRNDKLTGVAVFVLAPKEIVVVNARGNIQALITSAIRGNVNRKPRGDDHAGHAEAGGQPMASMTANHASSPPAS